MRLYRTLGAAVAIALLAGSASAQQGFVVEKPPSEATAPVYEAAFRTDTIELALSPTDDREGSELEYLIKMKPGATLVYSWTVEDLADGEEFYTDFHGHRDAADTRVMSYKEGTGKEGRGALTAPFEGTHGWLFQNQSMKPVKVKLTLAGFYELRSVRETMLVDETTEQLPFGPSRPAR